MQTFWKEVAGSNVRRGCARCPEMSPFDFFNPKIAHKFISTPSILQVPTGFSSAFLDLLFYYSWRASSYPPRWYKQDKRSLIAQPEETDIISAFSGTYRRIEQLIYQYYYQKIAHREHYHYQTFLIPRPKINAGTLSHYILLLHSKSNLNMTYFGEQFRYSLANRFNPSFPYP